MRIVSWNVNGLRAVGKKGFVDWLQASDADVCLLQETKAHLGDLPGELREVEGYRLEMASAKKKGYSGVAIYCREEPDEWFTGIEDEEYDVEGRSIWARYDDLLIGSLYFPNSQNAGKRIDYRLGYGSSLREWLDAQRDAGLHPVLGGDFNVAHEEIDLARPKENTKNAGFLPEERQWMTEFLADGWTDTWRREHPEEVGYSWWSYRAGARERNVGWRLDYFCSDAAIDDRLGETSIEAQTMGSDHCPVWVTID